MNAREHNRRLGLGVFIILLFVVILAAALAVLEYTNHAAYQAMVSRRVSAVHILRTSEIPQNHIPPFETTVNDAAHAQRLYDALLALPVMPPGTYACPADFGIAYHLTFYLGSASVATAMVKPDGCEGAILPDGSSRWIAPVHDSFWQMLADVAGVPISAILVGPQSDAPSPSPSPTPAPAAPSTPTPTRP